MDEAHDIDEDQAQTLRRLRERSAGLAERAYLRASAACGADEGDEAERWTLLFERMARSVRLTIALEAKLARARRRAAAGLPFDDETASAPNLRRDAGAEPRDPPELDHESEADDDGLPADAPLGERIANLEAMVEEAEQDFLGPRVRLIGPIRRAPAWADVPLSLRPGAPPADDAATAPWRGSG